MIEQLDDVFLCVCVTLCERTGLASLSLKEKKWKALFVVSINFHISYFVFILIKLIMSVN